VRPPWPGVIVADAPFVAAAAAMIRAAIQKAAQL
jgi:hypothetical protein